jgi:ubiquinone/menaquinone biosynthesis C-methylase UbiE
MPERLQPDSTQRFTGRAEVYDLYRQRYPVEDILTHLRAWCGLTPSWLVADIGAGTGMLAEVFLSNRNRVIAVEPNAEMREQMHATFSKLGKCWPKVEIIAASAEATTIPDASVDLIAVGRAFHWFDKDRALAEFRRILKPNGWVTLISLGRASLGRTDQIADPALISQVVDYERVLTEHGTDYDRIRAAYRIQEEVPRLFGGELHQAQLSRTQQLDWLAFRGQTMSLSVAPTASHPNHEIFMRELRSHFDTYARAGILTMPTICYIVAARF